MVIYMKFDPDSEPEQFTTALDAKEKMRSRQADSNLYFMVKKEAVADVKSLSFFTFGPDKQDEAIAKLEEVIGNIESEPPPEAPTE